MTYLRHHLLEGHSAAVYALHWAADTSQVYSGSSDGRVALWDVEAGAPSNFLVQVGKPVFSVFERKNHLWVGQNEGALHVIDLDSKKEIRHLKYHQKGIFALMPIEKTGVLLTAGGDGKLGVLDLGDYRLLLSISVSAMKLRCLCVNADQSQVWVGSSDGYIRVFDTQYFNELGAIKAHEGGVYSIALLPDGRLISGGRDAHLRFWEWDQTAKAPTAVEQAIPAHNFAIYSIGVSPQGNELATASRDKTLKIWQYGQWKTPQRIDHKGGGHSHSVNATLYAPSGKWLLSAGDDRKIAVWKREEVHS